MGKLNQGMFGPITGRVGDMVYYVLNGENVARKIGKSTKPPSEKQLAARQMMGVVTRFLKTFSELISVGFYTGDKRPTSSPYNRAVSYNLTNSTMGVYPDIELNYSKVLVNKGFLSGADSCAVSVVAEGLRFTWSYLELPYPRGND